MGKVRIKNLDTFRAIAALIVLIGHTEGARWSNFGHSVFEFLPSAHLSVILFFVISGFLISFLLSEEKKNYGTISIKDFYVRRILRIWPLYYLILLLSVVLLSHEPTTKAIAYAVSICPNIPRAFRCDEWSASPQIWSIGVENQFYIFFPLLVFFLSRKQLYTFLSLFIAGYTVLPHLIDFINVRTINSAALMDFNFKFYADCKFNSLAVGCLAGLILSDKSNFLKVLYNRYLFYISTMVAIVIWGLNLDILGYKDEIMTLLFAVIILNVCTNNDLDITFENHMTKFLGRISYGIYMYHWIMIELVYKILPVQDSILWNLIVHIMVLIATIFVAWLSYETYEKFFLNLKKKFER